MTANARSDTSHVPASGSCAVTRRMKPNASTPTYHGAVETSSSACRQIPRITNMAGEAARSMLINGISTRI